MRSSLVRAAGVAAAAAVVAVTAAGCGAPSITASRVENAVAPAFAQLYARQQALLGRDLGASSAQAAATCRRTDSRSGTTGAGDDWACALLLTVGGPTLQVTYDVTVKADGCYTAEGPPAIVGGRTLQTPSGGQRVNPLFAFDGCFDIS